MTDKALKLASKFQVDRFNRFGKTFLTDSKNSVSKNKKKSFNVLEAGNAKLKNSDKCAHSFKTTCQNKFQFSENILKCICIYSIYICMVLY